MNSIAAAGGISHNVRVRFPIITNFFIAVFVFAGCVYVGGFAAVWFTFQYERSKFFAQVGRDERKELQLLNQVLLGSAMSHVLSRGTPQALENDIAIQQKLRRKAPKDAQQILDLQVAMDHIVLVGFCLRANDSEGAAAQRDRARPLLNELGWKDTSDKALGAVADLRMKSIMAKAAK